MRFLSQPLKPVERFLALAMVLSFATFMHLALLTFHDGPSISAQVKLYLTFFCLTPLVCCAIAHHLNVLSDDNSARTRLFLSFNVILSLTLMGYLVSGVLSQEDYSLYPVKLYSVMQIVGSAIIALLPQKHYVPVQRYATILERLNKVFFMLFPCVFLVLCINNTAFIQGKVYQTLNYQLGVGLGFVVALCTLYARKLPKSTEKLCLIASVFMIAMLFEPGLSYDPHHYNSYVGPALGPLGGWLPFIDMHSHYGLLPVTLITWLFQWLPPSYEATGLLVRIAGVLQLLCAFFILRRSLGAKVRVYFLATLGIFIYVAIVSNDIYSFPSTTGYRHLPSYALLLALAYLPSTRRFTPFSIAALLLCAFWSIEQLLYGVAIYSALLAGNALAQGPRDWSAFKAYLKTVGLLLSVPAIAHMAYSGISLVLYGALPRYDIYYEIIKAFNTGNFWAHPVTSKHTLFGLHALVYSLGLTYALKVLWLNSPVRRQEAWEKAKYPLLIALLGICHMQYYVSRPSELALVIYSLPLIMMAVFVSAKLLESKEIGFWKPASGYYVIGVTMLTALLFARFTTPDTWQYSTSEGLTYAQHESQTNRGKMSSILRRWYAGHSIPETFAEIKAKLINPPITRAIGPNPEELKEMVQLIKKWQPNARSHAFLSGDFSVAALMYNGKANAYPMGFPTVDGISHKKRDRIIAYPTHYQEGDILISNCLTASEAEDDPTEFLWWKREAGYDPFGNKAPTPDKSEPVRAYTTTSEWEMLPPEKTTLLPGETYALSFEVKNGSAEAVPLKVYLQHSGSIHYSVPKTTSDQWQTITFIFESREHNARAQVGIEVIPALHGRTIEVKNPRFLRQPSPEEQAMLETMAKAQAAGHELEADKELAHALAFRTGAWCSIKDFDPVQQELLVKVMKKWDATLLERSPSGVKVFKLQARET